MAAPMMVKTIPKGEESSVRLRLAVLIVLALLTLGYRGAGFYLSYFSPDMRSQSHFSASLSPEGQMVIDRVDPETPAFVGFHGEKQLPQVGDRVVEIFDLKGQGGRILSLFGYGELLRRVGSVDPWTLVVDRPAEDGSSKMVVISLPPGSPVERSLGEWIIGLGFDLYLPLLALVAALFIGLMKYEDNRAYLAALVFLGFSAAFRQEFAQFHAGWREIALFIRTTAVYLSPVLILQFFFVFPMRSVIDQRWPWLRQLAFGMSVVFWIVALALEFTLHHSFKAFFVLHRGLAWLRLDYKTFGMVFSLFGGLLVCLGLLALGLSIWTARNKVDRRRMILLATGTCAGVVPLALINGVGQVTRVPPWLLLASLPLAGIFPLSFVYAVVRHRVFGIRLILRRGLKYALVSKGFLAVEGVVIFAALYFGALPLLGSIIKDTDNRFAWAGTLLLTFGLLAGVPRINGKILPAIDRRFFRDAYSAERMLTELSHAMREFASTPDQLLSRVSEEIARALHPTRIGIFIVPGTLKDAGRRKKEALGSWRAKVNDGGLPELYELVSNDSAPPQPGLSALEVDQSVPVLSSRVSLARHLARSVARGPELLEVFPVDHLLEGSGAVAPGRVLEMDFDEDQALFERFDTRLVVPLVTAGRALGFMLLGEKLSQEPYGRADKNLLLTVAEQASIALDYSSLIERVAEQERMKRELQIAKEVQAKLFPQELPAMETLSYSGVCRTAREVGGDYYDFLLLDSGRLGIALGDIAGKGISASLLMASLQALLRSHSLTMSHDLRRLVSELNHHLCQTTEDARFATFFFGTYNDSTRRLNYVNAGHTPPILLHRASEGESPRFQRLEPGGMVLGMFPAETYTQAEVAADPGDMLLIFSDGITEAMNEDGEQYGEQRLVDLVAASGDTQVAEISKRLFADVDAFVGTSGQQDDMTMITARVL